MAVPGAEDVYLTLLLTDTYLPGALVLAHSLRDGGTTKKLGVLVTLDSVAAEAITELKTVYDYVIPVPRIKNEFPANLSLMNRTDLAAAFTKINLWKQTNFRKIVYIDADVVAYRAPDELFDLPHAFSAAPDIGWPDIFNTGVMVLTPSMGEYYALAALAERGISFDGADQGLLNMHFKNTYNRLSFTYNVTPSGHYQYVPAYRHFQSSINMVHFIGTDKPWFQGRYASTGSGPYDEMIGRWWAVYDRHYRVESPQNTAPTPNADLVQYLTRGEYQPPRPQVAHVEHVERIEQVPHPQKQKKDERPPVTFSEWDAQRHPPPPDSKPEAANFPATTYEMSKETAPFVPPARYPSPPKDMWYKVPAQPPAYRTAKPKSIFPWENAQPRPTRVFPDEPSRSQDAETEKPTTPTGHTGSVPVTPITPTIQITSSDPWTAFTRTNAWDEVPEIERYVDKMQKHRRTRSLKSPGKIDLPSPSGEVSEIDFARRGSKVTDFPSAAERPSLPVTPAPIRRPKFWGGGDDGGHGIGDEEEADPLLPVAEGVPGQSEWDPVAQLQKLAKQQSEVLLQKLGGAARDSDDLPPRAVPFGSEELISPTYVAQSPPVLSPQPVKGSASSSIVRGMTDETATQASGQPSGSIPKPSYGGPGAEFEKGEDFAQRSTPLPPTEDERDVLET